MNKKCSRRDKIAVKFTSLNPGGKHLGQGIGIIYSSAVTTSGYFILWLRLIRRWEISWSMMFGSPLNLQTCHVYKLARRPRIHLASAVMDNNRAPG